MKIVVILIKLNIVKLFIKHEFFKQIKIMILLINRLN
jgi:hypothetical protein